MRRICWVSAVAAVVAFAAAPLPAQMMPGQGMGQGMGRPSQQPIVPSGDESPATTTENPDKAAKKAFNAGVKALNKAKEYAAAAANAPDKSDKRAKELEKLSDAYNTALDAFTEALANHGDMVEAWDNVGYVHLQLGAYQEAVDDYNHTLKLKPDLSEAVLHRAEAYVTLDRLDEAQAAYMELINHAPDLASQLMVVMQRWVTQHRADPQGIRPTTIDSFDKWLSAHAGATP
jgi:tetratricopeptide (TPR) repeat protein